MNSSDNKEEGVDERQHKRIEDQDLTIKHEICEANEAALKEGEEAIKDGKTENK